MTQSKREFGNLIESFACQLVKAKNLTIAATNFNTKLGEVDIIAQSKTLIIFIEVRYRKNTAYGGAGASVDFFKQQKLIKTAQLYLQQNNMLNSHACRFDVIALTGPVNKLNYEWIESAFDAS